ncbi:TA system antitoxin ParD family protein [Marinobacter sp. X15-166B]|uniref:TA system antitoxin ParD family protein n=1 Tax=Marinobacter sp. X15-166B TaxID=1897620 RepID=UPI00085CCAAD|nr:hypothetical protein [Marinobacter sp. X15-166B]OEY67535.1 hypothetical protein BG841_14560 [Marinobacter sp. X15-166B]
MTTPVRLDDALVQQAAAEARINRRSTPKQIEFWAEIGRAIAAKVSAEDLIAIAQGIRQVKVEAVTPAPVTSEDIWAEVDAVRESGELSRTLARGRTLYQASTEHPGYLEALHPGGQKVIGSFKNGQFEPLNDRDDAA